MTLFERIQVRTPALLVSLTALILIYPQFEGAENARVALTLILGAVMLGSLIAMRHDRKWLWPALLLSVPSTVASLMENPAEAPLGSDWGAIVHTVFFGLVAANLVMHALRPGRVDFDKLAGAMCGYLMIGVAFQNLFMLVEIRAPGSISFPDTSVSRAGMLYFSYVTLTTLGYGDVLPVSSQARSLAMIEAVTGVMFLAILVARLVSLYGQEIPHRRRPDQADSGPSESPESPESGSL